MGWSECNSDRERLEYNINQYEGYISDAESELRNAEREMDRAKSELDDVRGTDDMRLFYKKDNDYHHWKNSVSEYQLRIRKFQSYINEFKRYL